MTPEYNLVNEPWIRAMTLDGTIKEYSLKDLFLHAHECKMLSGDTVTQDAAITRILLAILYTVAFRWDADGVKQTPEDEDEVIDRWVNYWEKGLFTKTVVNYLDEWKERFWLFHDNYPFFQVARAQERQPKATAVSKMIGDLMEGANKQRLFAARSAEGKTELDYAEAARWLIFLEYWDDTSLKPTAAAKADKNRQSSPVGWLGRLGYVEATGNNLFETLMLNLVMLRDGTRMWDSVEQSPEWERDEVRSSELQAETIPSNAAEFMTFPSRRVLLTRQNGKVNGFFIYSGDRLEVKNAFAEQNTLWKKYTDKSSQEDYWMPQEHSSSRQIWREFNSIAAVRESDRTPGIAGWHAMLCQCGILSNGRQFNCRIAANSYDSSASHTINDSFYDELSFHLNILTDEGKAWPILIKDELEKCNKASEAIAKLSRDLLQAEGVRKESPSGKKEIETAQVNARLRLYNAFDRDFRLWLEKPDARQNINERKALIIEWRETAKRAAYAVGKEIIENAGATAFIGRLVDGKYYSSSLAFNHYQYSIKHIFEGGE